MEYLGHTKTSTYTTLNFNPNQKDFQDFEKKFDKSLNFNINNDKIHSKYNFNISKSNGNDMKTFDFDQSISDRNTKAMRAPMVSSLKTTNDRFADTKNYADGKILNDFEIPKLKDDNKLSTLPTALVTEEFQKVRNQKTSAKEIFTMEDWKVSNGSLLNASDRIKAGSELMRCDALRVCEAMCEKTAKAAMDSTKKLDDRTKDVEFWKKELQKALDELVSKTKKLEQIGNCISKATTDMEAPMKIILQCMNERKDRREIELVDDDVDKALNNELNNMRQQLEMLNDTYDVQKQLKRNKDLQNLLSRNIMEKHQAALIDTKCRDMKNTSANLKFHNGIEHTSTTVCDSETWVENAVDLIKAAQQEKTKCQAIEENVDKLLSTHAESLRDHWNATNEAFSFRIQDHLSAKKKLELHLEKLTNELVDAQKTLEYLKKNIKDTNAPIKLAQTRLFVRSERPNMESCLDPAQQKLTKELSQLDDNADELVKKLREAEFVEQHLLRSIKCLQHDLNLKNHSFFIDRDRCLSWRKCFIMNPLSRCCFC